MAWFYISDFPREAIDDCSGEGDATEAVAYWVERLDFRPDPEATRLTLKEYGAWCDEDLADDEENRHRLFWVMMGDFAEWDGTEDSPSGSDVFCIC
jgi:hypothetical protein